MRILNLDGRYFVRSLRRLGHEVLSLGQAPECDLVLAEHLSLKRLLEILDSRGFTPDLVLWCDVCRPPTVAGLEALPLPTVGFSIDQYCNPWHVPYSAAFDHFFVAQRDYLDIFRCDGLPRPVEWMPLFCDPDQDRDENLERDIPASFVGTLAGSINRERAAFFRAFKARHPIVLRGGAYQPVFARTRLVVNQSAAGELNFRIFEAAACGAAVLTEDTGNGLREIFAPGENILVYPRGAAAAAAAAAADWLARPDDLAALARAGRDLVRSRHTAAVRARTLAATARELTGHRSWEWRKRNPKVREQMGMAYGMLAQDPELPLPGELRAFYVDLAERLAGLDEPG